MVITPERLKAIKERCERATKGPWTAEPEVDEYGFRTGSACLVMGNEPKAYDFDRMEDAEFCAHAREDVPALVAEVERCWAENERLHTIIRRLAKTKQGLAEIRDVSASLGLYSEE